MPLTPVEFNLLATKEDLNQLKKNVEKIGEDVNEIITTLDGIAKSFKDHEEEHDANIAAHDRFEGRITVLEEKAGAA